MWPEWYQDLQLSWKLCLCFCISCNVVLYAYTCAPFAVGDSADLVQANQFRVAEARGVEAVVAAMTRFSSQTTVQLSALLCFIPLALENIMMQASSVAAAAAAATASCTVPLLPLMYLWQNGLHVMHRCDESCTSCWSALFP